MVSSIPLNKTIYAPQCQIVATHLTRMIRDGKFRQGEKIPSVRSLAEMLGVGRQVVLSAIAILSRAGLVYTDTKQGTFVSSNLKSGLCYQIGFFNNRENPMMQGAMMEKIYRIARHEGFQVLPGSNYNEDWGLGEWLDRNPEIDGLLITGIVDDRLLETMKGRGIPYFVLGNYDIAPHHPQSLPRKGRHAVKLMAEAFQRSGGERIAAITGVEYFLSHRESLREVREALVKAGKKVDESLLYYCNDDGYSVAKELLERRHPDVIFFRLDHWIGYLKYLEQHPGVGKPYVIVHNLSTDEAPCRFYDDMIAGDKNDKAVKYGTLKLINMVKNSYAGLCGERRM